MMYNNKLIAAIKVGGKILREFGDVVQLPFGSEYTVLLKNINTKRALVDMTIDGQDVFNKRSLLMEQNSEIEISRFVYQLDVGNSFKFIERTASVENHRGIKSDDGIIRIAFRFEYDRPKYELSPIKPRPNFNGLIGSSGRLQRQSSGFDSLLRASTTKSSTSSTSFEYGIGSSTSNHASDVQCHTYSSQVTQASTTEVPTATLSLMDAEQLSIKNDVGITVPGSINNQQFQIAEGFLTESVEHVIILRLSGIVENQAVQQPITVKTKPTCTTCGKVNKATNKFCSECGTSLQIVA